MQKIKIIAILIILAVCASPFDSSAKKKKNKEPDNISLMTRNELGVFPKPANINFDKKYIGFYRPALVVPVSLEGTPIVGRMKSILEEFGLQDVPVKKLSDSLWKYDSLIYLELQYPKSPMAGLLKSRGSEVNWRKLGQQGYAIHTFPV